MVAPITAPPANTPGDFAGNPVLFDQTKMAWYLWFQAACPQFSALATDLQAEILAAVNVAASASATAAANAVLASKVTGPASATANALAKFDGATGKLVKVSGLVEDESGSLGLGVPPNSGWLSSVKAFQFSPFGAAWSQANGSTNLAFNVYESAANTFNYLTSDDACMFSVTKDGGFEWMVAPSGTAGNPISFIRTMNLDAGGTLDVSGAGRFGKGLQLAGAAGLGSVDNALLSYEAPNTRLYIGDGTGYSFRITKRVSSTNTDLFAFTDSGNLQVGAASAVGKVTVESANATAPVVNLTNTSASLASVLLNIEAVRTTADGSYNFIGCAHSGVEYRFQVRDSGNVVNTNNSYGAISDLKLKENIVDVTPKLAKLLQVRIVNYTLKADPNKTKLMGVIAQELEQISPGLIEETPDFEEVTRTREVTKTVPVTEQAAVLREQKTVEVVDGKAIVKTEWLEELADVPVVDHYPLFDADGLPVLEIATPEVPAVTDADGNVTQPAVAATYRHAMHSVPRMKEVTETETYTERVATGTTTKSVKYSVFVPMLIKAMQEQQAQIDALSGRSAALEAA